MTALEDDNGGERDNRRYSDFSVFYRQQFTSIVALAGSVAGNTSIAEDVAQEAFHQASNRWDKIVGFDNPSTWVRRVAINLALNHKRRRGRELAALLRIGALPPVAYPTEPDREVWEAVANLPGKQRAAVSLFYLDGYTTAEIAKVLECAESTARAHLFKARKSLAHALGEAPDVDLIASAN